MRLVGSRAWCIFVVHVLFFGSVSEGCIRGGRLSIRRPKNEPPLVFHEHVPNAPELSPDASGKAEVRVRYKSPRFQRLAYSENPDIQFKNEEFRILRKGMVKNEDHYMTQRCKEKLDYLSILVKNTWPEENIKLRVIEAWDQMRHHGRKSLHYEGRALDLTTSDRDRRKLGLLARRAVQAGFDYVFYESRNFIHVSCKSDYTTSHRKALRCFPGSSVVTTPSGPKPLAQIKEGDLVMTLNSRKNLVFSPVINFLDRLPELSSEFLEIKFREDIEEDQGRDSHFGSSPGTPDKLVSLKLTEYHLIYKLTYSNRTLSRRSWYSEVVPLFANELKIGDIVLRRGESGQLVRAQIVSVTKILAVGAYAPLTMEGTIVVDDTVASCYAATRSERLAHASVFPLRAYYHIRNFAATIFPRVLPNFSSHETHGIHAWAWTLLKLADFLSPLVGKITV